VQGACPKLTTALDFGLRVAGDILALISISPNFMPYLRIYLLKVLATNKGTFPNPIIIKWKLIVCYNLTPEIAHNYRLYPTYAHNKQRILAFFFSAFVIERVGEIILPSCVLDCR
jgi:hypothetical protein